MSNKAYQLAAILVVVITLLSSIYLGISTEKPYTIILLPILIFGALIALAATVPLTIFISALPHELGHYFFGRLRGLNLFAITIFPFHVNVYPSFKISLHKNTKSYLGMVWMGTHDGSFNAKAWSWCLIGGPLSGILAGLLELEISNQLPYSYLVQYLRLVACFSIYLSIFSLITIQRNSDRSNLSMLYNAPDLFSAYFAAGQMTTYCSQNVSPTEWPEALWRRVGAESLTTGQKCDLLARIFQSTRISLDSDSIAIVIAKELKEIDSWPENDPHSFEFRTYIATYLASNLALPAAAELVLPLKFNSTPILNIRWHIAKAAIVLSQEGELAATGILNEALERLDHFERELPKKDTTRQLAEFVSQHIQLFKGEHKLLYQIRVLWVSGLRPREWNWEWIQQISKTNPDDLTWAYSMLLQLYYWIDCEKDDEAEGVIFEFQRNRKLKSAQKNIVASFWCCSSMFYSIRRKDIALAKLMLAKANPKILSYRMRNTTLAAIMALEGNKYGGLQRLAMVEDYEAQLPDWLPFYDWSNERHDEIRAMCV